VFDCSNSAACNETAVLRASDSNDRDRFGSDVAIQDGWVTVAAIFKENDAGRVYLFDCRNSSLCVESEIFIATDGIPARAWVLHRHVAGPHGVWSHLPNLL